MINGDTSRVPASVLAVLAAGPSAFPIFNATAIASSDATIQAHRDRQSELVAASEAIVAAADAERRELTGDESRQIDANTEEFERLEAECSRREKILAQQDRMNASRGRVAMPEEIEEQPAAEPVIQAAQPQRPVAHGQRMTVPAQPRISAAGNHGFRSFGDFARAVYNAAQQGGQVDQRLIRNAAASTYSQEGIGSDGGYTVPPDFSSRIMTRMFDQDSLLGRCDVQVTSGNAYTAPIDETTPWGTTGVRAYWTKEADAGTQTKPALGEINVRLHKLMALCPVTEEMLQDSASIDGYLSSKMPDAIDWAVNYALIWGTGAGQPLGVMNAPALVTQAAEGAQTADTINAQNVVKMLSRMPPRSRATAVWLIHPDAEPQLPLMTLANQPVYMPPGGLSDAPYGRLLGRPVIAHQVCSTVGDLGDIMLVDFSQYLAVRKAAGVQVSTSMHLWFDQDITAFKATFRLGGQPWWSAAQTPRSGSNTVSPLVTLAAR